LHHALLVLARIPTRFIVLSVFKRSFAFAYNLYFAAFAPKYKKVYFFHYYFLILTIKCTFALILVYPENIFFSLLPTKRNNALFAKIVIYLHHE